VSVAVEKTEGPAAGPSVTPSGVTIRRLAISRGVTSAGGNAAFWALSAMLYQETHSVTLVAVTALVSFSVPAALSPLAGLLGDHQDRRRVMVGSEFAGAMCFLAMAAATASPAALLGLRVLASIASAPLEPATNAALPSLVPGQELDRANAAMSRAGTAGCLVGVAIAGVMLPYMGGASVFFLNALTFLVSATVIFSLRGDFKPLPTQRGKMIAGFGFLRQEPLLGTLSLAYAIVFLGIGITIPLEVVIADKFGAGTTGYAAMIVLWGAGGVLGAGAGNTLRVRSEKTKVIGFAALGIAAALFAVGTAPNFAVVLAGMAVGGIGQGLWEVTQTSLAQRLTPDGLRGRVFAAIGAAMQISIALGLLLSDVVTAAIGPTGAFAVAGGTVAAAALLLIAVAIPAELHSRRRLSQVAVPKQGDRVPLELPRTA
jgi:MFS family permease